MSAAACGTGSSANDFQVTSEAPDALQPANCKAPPAVAAGQPGAGDWTTYHRGNERAGALPASRKASKLSPLWGARLDGAVFTQPLLYQGLVFVATEHNSVYAFDARSGCLAWQTSLGPSFDGRTLKCTTIPELGVNSTPVIDPAGRRLYAIAYLPPGRFLIVGLDLAGGAVVWQHPVELPAGNPLDQLSRPALALANGRVYASFGGRAPGDCGDYRGFVVGVRPDGGGPDVVFQASPNPKGAIWAPGGPAVLPNGDLLVTTSNTDTEKEYDGSNAVVRLSPSLQKLDFFAAPNWAQLNHADFDLGSVGPTVVGDGKVFQSGKDGIGYLLDLNHLGGIGGQLYSSKLQGGCYAIGATAFLAPYIYVPCDHGTKAVKMDGARFQTAWTGPNFRSGSPIVAAGLVWTIDFEAGYLWALDPASGDVKQKAALGGVADHFVSPSADGGHVYVPAGRRLLVFSVS
jgi:polyvinyl alcohol dehydrogenase (cytochrome)